jgi:glycosyltransferase involved in cell wall biosynthesis
MTKNNSQAPMAKVSVIVPSYNHEKFVANAIGSALNQTVSEIELIVIEDGSTDRSPLILDGLARDEPRMKVVHQENSGSHAAINNGLLLASAPWVAILNSDDEWESNRLETMLGVAEQSGSSFLFSDTILIDADGKSIEDRSHWWNLGHARVRQRALEHGLVEGLLYGNLTVSTSNFLFRRDVLDKVGWFRPYKYNLDWDFVLRCAFDAVVKVFFVHGSLLRYRLHGKNAILGGMPLAAIEAQDITRRVYRDYYGAPQSLSLSHFRHDRLLRKYLNDKSKQYAASCESITADRDRIAKLLAERQSLIEAERKEMGLRLEGLAADMSAMEASRDELSVLLSSRQEVIEKERVVQDIRLRNLFADISALTEDRDALAALLSSRQTMIDAERSVHEVMRARDQLLLQGSYLRSVEVAAERDRAALLVARMAEASARHQEQLEAWKSYLSRGFRQRLKDIVRLAKRPSLPASMEASDTHISGRVLEVPRDAVSKHTDARRVAAHVHIYYRDLASELLTPLLQIPDLYRVVITGPWDAADLGPSLDALKAYCSNVCVAKIPNRGKDIGGLAYAIKHEYLLDSDYLLKIHSKKSQNPDTYFEAISALFGMRIDDGDQWRRALVAPLIGSAQRIKEIVHWFDSDSSLGMVGASAFVSTAPDSNAELYRKVCSGFGVPCGMPFVAGTMFWVRSSLLMPLLQGPIKFDDFDVDSREVEGGLEHIMERIFGSFVLAKGFDLLKVGP